jgi:Helicase C-terminal domain/Type III restriction enzyme, res subunit
MNTGGGKTLIATLIAQSLVNETAGHVVYVCSTNQLIEQTRQQADECGLETAAYFGGSWQNEDVYRQARGPCVSNYAALCNGKSIFRRDIPAAIIMDDAHVAAPSIRNAFTLRIPAGTELFGQIASLYQQYFKASGHEQDFVSLVNGDPIAQLFVPAFQINRTFQKLSAILLAGGVADEKSTLFAWEHLRDHLDRCAAVLSSKRIEIGPAIPPLDSLPQLSQCPRIVYMTATLPSATQFQRIFGSSEFHTITPGGKSGDAQRLFVFADGDTDEEQRTWVKGLIKQRKACILTASTEGASEWTQVARLYDGNQGQQGLDAFKTAGAPEKLVMAARYDGIDLPGDSCRMLVIDDLPRGAFLLERFADETLHIEGLRASSTAIRVTQAIGRIFRSNTDHGVVILCGRDLQAWLSTPKNQAYLPDLLQRQIQLSLQLKDNVASGSVDYDELIDGVLTGQKDWDNIYQDAIGAYDTQKRPQPDPWLVEAAGAEHNAFASLWNGDYDGASLMFQAATESVGSHDAGLAGWYYHWAGLSSERAGKSIEAFESYRKAANARAQLGRPKLGQTGNVVDTIAPGPQADAIAILAANIPKALKRIDNIKATLLYGDNTNATEAALADLGSLLGLAASRPDNDEKPKTGPDVLWRLPAAKIGAALEAKTNKEPESMYQKKEDIGQFHDHVLYLKKKFPKESFIKGIVGRSLPVSAESNPPEDLRIIPLEGFQELTERARSLYEYIAAAPDSDPAPVKAQRWLGYLGLVFPACVDALSYSLATDLQQGKQTPDLAF